MRKKKVIILIESMLAVLVIFLLMLKAGDDMETKRLKVSVIVQNPDSDEWSAFKYGLAQAAKDQNVDVLIASTEKLVTAEDEKRAIEQEIKRGADALIIQLVPRMDAKDTVNKIETKIPIMVVGSEGTTDEHRITTSAVEVDQKKLGEAIVKEVLKDYDGNLHGKRIGIFSKSTDFDEVYLRAGESRKVLEEAGATLKWFVAGDFAEHKDAFLEAQGEVDIVLALDDRSVVRFGEYAVSHPLEQTTVYGIGHSMEAVYYLDADAVDCLLVPDEFNVGYQSLTKIVDQIQKSGVKLPKKEASYTIMRKETLFSEENQNILFTMGQ